MTTMVPPTIPSMAVNAAIFLLILFFGITAIRWKYAGRIPKGLRPVPGPQGSPIIGNTLQLKPQPQRQMESWARQYGELFKIQLGYNNWVYLCSPQAVKEILDKQSAITSGRAPSPVVSDVISGGMRFLFMGYSPQWRKLRTIVHQLLTPKASGKFRSSQEFEAKQLVWDVLKSSEVGDEESFYMHVRRYTTSIVMTSTYGKRVPKWVRAINIKGASHLLNIDTHPINRNATRSARYTASCTTSQNTLRQVHSLQMCFRRLRSCRSGCSGGGSGLSSIIEDRSIFG
jgi:cytochrome P450